MFLFLVGLTMAQSAYDDLLKTVYKNTVPQIKTAALKKKIETNKKLLILDTRSPEEYEVMHISGARLID